MKYIGNSYSLDIQNGKSSLVNTSELVKNNKPKSCSINSCYIVLGDPEDDISPACWIDACGANACGIKLW